MNLIGVAVDRPRGRMILAIVPLGLLVKMRVHGISRVMKNECAK